MIYGAPAKSLVLYTKSHTGFYTCTNCTVKEKYLDGRICFPNTTSYSLRTDELFAINGYKNFQTGYFILNNVPDFLPISNTPLDYMHLLCLGVVKKLILLWMKGQRSVCLNRRSINKISHLLILFRSNTPSDFVRKPRSIQDVRLWKVVEFRNFLLYTGPIVLKYSLSKDMYHHFLTLHVAITILVHPNLCKTEFVDYAEALLENLSYLNYYMVKNIYYIMSTTFCIYVRMYGSLDCFSAFRFKNFMMSIKNY